MRASAISRISCPANPGGPAAGLVHEINTAAFPIGFPVSASTTRPVMIDLPQAEVDRINTDSEISKIIEHFLLMSCGPRADRHWTQHIVSGRLSLKLEVLAKVLDIYGLEFFKITSHDRKLAKSQDIEL